VIAGTKLPYQSFQRHIRWYTEVSEIFQIYEIGWKMCGSWKCMVDYIKLVILRT